MPVLHIAYGSEKRSAFEARQQRAGGAAGVSLAAHVLFLFATYIIVARPDASGTVASPPDSGTRPELVWFAAQGPGGGGGGGGNRTSAPPAILRTRGLDALSIPVLTPPPLTPPREQSEPRPDPPEIALHVPVTPMDAGQIAVMGAVDGSSLAPPDSRGSGTNGGAGTGDRGGSGPGDGPGLGPGLRGGTDGGVFDLGAGITPPQAIRVVKPVYTAEAMQRRIQGEVLVTAIVRSDGTVTDARVSRSLDGLFGLDEEAIRTALQWRFKPAARLGRPVAVYVTIGVGFTMH